MLLLLQDGEFMPGDVRAGSVAVAVPHVKGWPGRVAAVLFVQPRVIQCLLGRGAFAGVELKEETDKADEVGVGARELLLQGDAWLGDEELILAAILEPVVGIHTSAAGGGWQQSLTSG